ncbi:MAG TPA: cytochrome c1 [Kiloniellales bacterium]|jgi:ubiquinol-cytochrome c reductase cytochrome c1 subunit|nr:cytochrome c1 [Kiloniellales bacterium]
MKKLAIIAAAAAFLGLAQAPVVQAAEEVEIPSHDWSFSGMFGTFDRAKQQRGLQVYREVCAACHGLRLVAFRNLADLGYNEDEIRSLAADYQVEDGPDENGDMFMRDGVASDRFPAPFPNENAARMANNGALPPDLSLITKARQQGPDYLYHLLLGYQDPPAGVEMMDGMYYNAYFPGHQIAMAPPLMEGAISYADGTPATTQQMAEDVTYFLTWAAEPNLEARKQMGMKVILFLLIFTGLLYAVKRKVWADLH